MATMTEAQKRAALKYQRKRGGTLPPNGRETWLDVQARALYQAVQEILRIEKGC